jgi:hypothetical protein
VSRGVFRHIKKGPVPSPDGQTGGVSAHTSAHLKRPRARGTDRERRIFPTPKKGPCPRLKGTLGTPVKASRPAVPPVGHVVGRLHVRPIDGLIAPVAVSAAGRTSPCASTPFPLTSFQRRTRPRRSPRSWLPRSRMPSRSSRTSGGGASEAGGGSQGDGDQRAHASTSSASEWLPLRPRGSAFPKRCSIGRAAPLPRSTWVRRKAPFPAPFWCGAYRDRTGDLRLAKPALASRSPATQVERAVVS